MGEKYAVLISGDLAENGYEEFWYDVVLMREALINNGFLANNIYVLYGNGADYFNVNRPNPRYRPNPAITNFSATTANVTNVFNGLANGTGGFPQMTDDDLLFVWTFDHGCGPPCIGGTSCVLGLTDADMQDTTFATLVNQIPHAYRIFCMQQCHSGGFINDLQSDRTVIITACTSSEHATPADTENEVVNGVTYTHGEFNFHLFSALNGQSVTGTAVNADANGNGFVTMREVFDYIRTNESKAETPQYDDGTLHLGERLDLSFADVCMRDNLQDTGIEPSPGASLCRSPDICHYRQQLLDPQDTLGSASAWNQDNLFETVEIGQPNYIYVRLRNRGYAATPVELDVYWTLPSTLPTPSGWNFIGTIQVPSIARDEMLVAGPLEWNTIPERGHYCFVAILGNAQDLKPDFSAIASAADFHSFIRNSNNVAWKNFDVENVFAGGYQRFEFHIQGWPRVSLASDLELDLTGLPATTQAELRILKRLTAGAVPEGMSKKQETKNYTLFEVASGGKAALRKMPLKPSDDSLATLHITLPGDVPDGAYEVSARQMVNGQEMGTVSKRILVGDYPYAANRGSGELHVANCEWARIMSPRNKVAYRELDLALKHGYNGCRYCLPEHNTG